MITLDELANAIGAELKGVVGQQVSGLAPPEDATDGQVTFIARAEYLPKLDQSKTCAAILSPEFAEKTQFQGAQLLVSDPYLAYAKASKLFDWAFHSHTENIHPSAFVSDEATLGQNVHVGANASIEAGADIGDGAVIGAGSVVGANAKLGANSRLHANVTLYHDVVVGQNCIIHSGTVIGSDGFGFSPSPEGWVKIHQLGRVVVGDNVEIGANTAIDRGALGDTEIASGVIIDNLVHIAHNVKIGKNTAIAGCCGIAGSTTIGENCTFAGQVEIGRAHV